MREKPKKSPTAVNVAPDTVSAAEPKAADGRYSLKAILAEVAAERRNSHFARELVDTTEIEKMFNKQIRNKKKK